jgi:hypothetical protein
MSRYIPIPNIRIHLVEVVVIERTIDFEHIIRRLTCVPVDLQRALALQVRLRSLDNGKLTTRHAFVAVVTAAYVAVGRRVLMFLTRMSWNRIRIVVVDMSLQQRTRGSQSVSDGTTLPTEALATDILEMIGSEAHLS